MCHTSHSASWLGLCPLLWVISLWSAAKTCLGSDHLPPPTVPHREQARTPAQKHCDALTYHDGALRSMRSQRDGWAELQAARCESPPPPPCGCQLRRTEHGWRLGVHRGAGPDRTDAHKVWHLAALTLHFQLQKLNRKVEESQSEVKVYRGQLDSAVLSQKQMPGLALVKIHVGHVGTPGGHTACGQRL